MTPLLSEVDAIVFDLDDTLIDWWNSTERTLSAITEPTVVERLQDHCRRHYWERWPDSDHVLHRNTWKLHERRHLDWPAALGDLRHGEVIDLIGRFEAELWVDLFPDAASTLDVLVGHRRLAVLSNNQRVTDEAARLGLDRWFEVIAAAPFHSPKPSSSAFLEIAGRLGLPPQRCAYVGDSIRADVLGARGAGMVPVWLNVWADDWPDRPEGVIEIRRLADLVTTPG